jgi:hypothetical protein
MGMQFRPIFIVGSSRSGTTMMGRIVGKSDYVHTFRELHFFEEVWVAADAGKAMSLDKAVTLGARLLAIENEGYLCFGDSKKYMREAKNFIRFIPLNQLTRERIYECFLYYYTKKLEKKYPCEHTPGYVFYIQEILQLYKKARFICMVRDCRDVILSQKYRWKKRSFGVKGLSWFTTVRNKLNYDPVIMSKLWYSTIKRVMLNSRDERVIVIKFEDLLFSPERTIGKICEFLSIPYNKDMLLIPQVGSSLKPDKPTALGINKTSSGYWQLNNNGLSQSEIFICQLINRPLMQIYDYKIKHVKPNWIIIIFTFLTLPLKATCAYVINNSRFKNILNAINDRFC